MANIIQTGLQRISNALPAVFNKTIVATGINKKGINVNKTITPVQFVRFRHDVSMWRDAVKEAEQAYYPYRVKMQRMYMDTILNGHTKACWDKRRKLSLLRDFMICTPGLENDVENLDATAIFKKQWFKNFLSFCLDARAYGYSLISLNDVTNSEFKGIEIVKRWLINPDTEVLTPFEYGLSGTNFLSDPEVAQWTVYVPTTNESGASKCGYGLLYEVAILEIYLKSILGFNVDYAQNYGQPLRKGTTSKTDEIERQELADALASMGSEAWILLDPTDDVELVETKGAGQGYKVYESLEQRCQKVISKIILGHADVLDSVPTKMGGGHEKSPSQLALEETQSEDATFLEPIVNDQLIPRMRKLGFPIPEGLVFKFKNDQEKEETRDKEDKSNKVTAEIAQTMSQGGLVMDAKYFTERTGIPCKAAPKAPAPPKFKPAPDENIQNVLNKFYPNK